jgi:hypothetical protein
VSARETGGSATIPHAVARVALKTSVLIFLELHSLSSLHPRLYPVACFAVLIAFGLADGFVIEAGQRNERTTIYRRPSKRDWHVETSRREAFQHCCLGEFRNYDYLWARISS